MENIPTIEQLQVHSGKVVGEDNIVRYILDPVAAIRVITPERFAVHDGNSYTYSTAASIVAGQAAYFLGKTADKSVHFIDFHVKCDSAPIVVEYFEAPTVTVLGTLSESKNRNRQIDAPASLLVYLNPTVTNDGDRLFIDKILGTQQTVSSEVINDEWLLAKNTDYIFKVTNQSVQTANVAAFFSWTETA